MFLSVQTYIVSYFAYLSRVFYVLSVSMRTTRDILAFVVTIINIIILTRTTPLTTRLLQALGEIPQRVRPTNVCGTTWGVGVCRGNGDA